MNPIELYRVTVAGHPHQRPILDEVSLTVPEAASLGLIGPNGSGKTTLLRALIGLARPAAGRVVVGGIDVCRDAVAVRRLVGYVPDQFGVYARLSIFQYLEFFAKASGVSQWERRNTVDTMLRVVDLFDQRQQEAALLSRGARRRLALARALLHNPPILLLDDPLGGLDGRGRLELVEVLKEVRGMGITMVVATHLLADLAQICDSVAVLNGGHLAEISPLAEALGREGHGRQRLWVEVVEGHEMVSAVLARQSGVLDVTQEEAGVSFVFQGDRQDLAGVLDGLVDSGAKVTQFGRGLDHMDEIAASLAGSDGSAHNGAGARDRRSA